MKKIKPITKPKVHILCKDTLIGKNNKISKSNIKNASAIRKKEIWKVFLVWPKIGLNPHSYVKTFSESGRWGESKKFNNNKTKAKIGTKTNNIIKVIIIN